jgi:CRISPR system Cascade subunit CasB
MTTQEIENPDTSDSPGTPEGEADLRYAVGATVARLQSDMLGEHGDRARTRAKATLAELRRQAGKEPFQDPLSLQRVLMTLRPMLKSNDVGTSDAPSRSEEAAFHALTLFALHMQSSTTPVHRRGTSFASACGQLYTISESQSMKPRFDALLLARSSRSRLIHTRSMVTLLRSNSIGFDYARFADDLRALAVSKQRSGVLLRWGRDFATGGYRASQHDSQSDEHAAPQPAP